MGEWYGDGGESMIPILGANFSPVTWSSPAPKQPLNPWLIAGVLLVGAAFLAKV